MHLLFSGWIIFSTDAVLHSYNLQSREKNNSFFFIADKNIWDWLLLWMTMGELKVSCSGMMDKALVSMNFPGPPYSIQQNHTIEAQDIIVMNWKPVSISTTINKAMLLGEFLQLLPAHLYYVVIVIEGYVVPNFVGSSIWCYGFIQGDLSLYNCLAMIKECGCKYQADHPFSVVHRPASIIWASRLEPGTGTLFLLSRPTQETN